MKRRRHVIGGHLLLVVAAVLVASGGWTVVDDRVLRTLAAAVGLAAVANVVVGFGWPATVLNYREPVATATALVFALLAATIAIENALAPDGPGSYLLAVLWGVAALFAGWFGADRLRTGRTTGAELVDR